MLKMYVSFLYFHQLKSTFEVDELMQIKDQFVFTKLIHFLLMNVTESEGGRRRRGWNPSIFMFSPPKHLINSLKERCNVFCIYTCLTLRWKVICSCHHSKLIKNEMTGLSKAVRSCCSVMGCRLYRLNFSRGRGAGGREREQSTILWNH